MTESWGRPRGAVLVRAVEPDHPDAPVAAHYGDPAREQRIMATRVGLVDRGNRQTLIVSGAERLSWLHSLTTQYLIGLGPMRGTESLLLSPNGQVENHAGVVDDGAVTYLDVEPGYGQSWMSFLTSMVFRLAVAVEDATARWAMLSLAGPATPQVLSALGAGGLAGPELSPVPPPKFAAGTVPSAPTSVYPASGLAGFDGWVRRVPGGADLLVPRSAVGDLVQRAGVPLVGIWAYEALRIAARRPRLGFETDHRTLPADVLWYSALHLAKGCYRGQETVAKTHHLGRAPRRLVLLHLDGVVSQQPPPRHTPVIGADGRVVGVTGTGARHYEYGLVVSAVVRSDVVARSAAGTLLRVGESAAAIDPDLCGPR